MENRVVISGIGIYSCLGKNLNEVATSLYQGKSGIICSEARKEFGYRSGLTGFVERPHLKDLLDRRTRIMLPEQGEYAYMSTIEAMKNAKMDQDYLDEHETGIIFGNDSSAKAVIEANDIMREKKKTIFAGSGSVFQTLNSTVNMNLATIFKLKGINFTVSAACASGSHSIGLAYFLIKHGYQERVVCGGAQELDLLSMGSFDALSAFSIREDEPTKASRPFDRDRDGLIPSGGAATVIVESFESAQKRGAPIFAEVIGYGFSSNGGHISTPTVEGPYKSICMAIKDAKIDAKNIDYINAHATSTPQGDANEAQSILKAIDGLQIPVSSTKSMTGHECWMAGASEIVYSCLMMQENFCAPNINFENPDEHSAQLNIVSKTLDKKIQTILSNSFGFGGTNSTLIIKKWNP